MARRASLSVRTPEAGRHGCRMVLLAAILGLAVMLVPTTPAAWGATASPTGLRVTGSTTTSLDLSWNAVRGAPKYRIQYSTSASMAGAVYRRFTATSAALSGLKANTRYYVKVRVITTDGANLSSYSSAVTGTTRPFVAAPTGLRFTGSATTSLDVAWNAVRGAPKYRIQYSTSASMAGAVYRRFTATSAALSGLKANTRYYVKVRVITTDGANLSNYSAAVSASTKAGYPAPAALKVGERSTTSVALSWGSRGPGVRYRVQYATRSSMSGAGYVRFTSPSGTVQGLKSATTYWFKVRVITVNGDNLSPYSGSVKADTAPKLATAPVPTGATLRVGSFNVKCANCVGTQPNERTWYDRRDDVAHAILAQHLDVLGVQEASQGWLKDGDSGESIDLSQFEDLRNRLAGTWELANANRNNCVKSKTPTGCVYTDRGASQGTKILYDQNRVDLLDNGSKLLTSASPTSGRYLAWAVFRQRSTGKKFFFADAHLEPNQDWNLHVTEATEVAQEVSKRNTAKLPTFIVGDLNSHKNTVPSNGVYDVIVDKYGYVDPLGNRAGSRTDTPGATVENRINTWLNSYNDFIPTPSPLYYGRRPNGTYIDYIFTSPGVRVPEWETAATLDADHNYVGPQPSDHNLIRASVVLP